MQKKTPNNQIENSNQQTSEASRLSCPAQEVLLAIISDTHAVDDETQAHLQSCIACQTTLQTLSDLEAMADYRKPAQKMSDPAHNLAPPFKAGDLGAIGDIPIECVLGRGGMGIVYRGRDEKLGRPIAVKILAYGGSHQTRQRFLREARALSKFEHPHVVAIYSAGESADGRPWISMPLIDGRSLKHNLGKDGMGPDEAARIILQVAHGLGAAHDAGLLHRDIKPANILIDEKNNLAKLADFGLVRNMDGDTMTQTDVFCGTPEYVSPEQITSPENVDQRSDVYSLGITLYECLTGISPYRGSPMEILDQHKNSEPVAPKRLKRNIPDDLQNICLKAMQNQPSARYQTAIEFAEDLQRFADRLPVLAKPISPFQKAMRWCGRNKAIAVFAATSLFLLAALAAGSTYASFQLRTSNKLLVKETQKANHAEKIADQNRSIAIDTLNKLINEVYEDLTDNAASIKSRRTLANSVISGLEALTDTNADAMSEEANWRAHLRIAELAQLQGNHQNCVANFNAAIQICKDSIRANNSNWDASFAKATTQTKLAQHMARVGSEDAVENLETAKQALLDLDRRNEKVDQWLLSLDISKLDLQRQKQFLNSRSQVEAALKIEKKHAAVLSTDFASKALLQELQSFYFVFGRALLEMGQPENAKTKFQAGRTVLDRAIKLYPDNRSFQTQLAIMIRALGMTAGTKGELARAEEHISDALTRLVALGKQDPDDMEVKLHIANTRSIMADSFAANGHYESATQQLELAIPAYDFYIENTAANNVRLAVWEAYIKLANNYLAAENVESAFEVMKLANEDLLANTTETKLAPAEKWFRSVVQNSFSISKILHQGFKDDSSPDGKFGASFWVAIHAAKGSSSLKMSDETLNLIGAGYPDFNGETLPEFYAFLFNQNDVSPMIKAMSTTMEAATYGLIYNNLANENAPREQIEELVDLIIASVKRGTFMNGPNAVAAAKSTFQLKQFRREDKWKTYISLFENTKSP